MSEYPNGHHPKILPPMSLSPNTAILNTFGLMRDTIAFLLTSTSGQKLLLPLERQRGDLITAGS